MIYHGNRMRVKEGADAAQVESALEVLREQGTAIPSVKWFTVGREHGSEFDWSAIFAFEDLDGYSEYLGHPAHHRTQRAGLPLMEKFETFDISDDPDPGLGAKIAELQMRHYAADPGLVELVAALPSHVGSSAVEHG
ncbi:Dabb family protein [Lentzea sp. NPDC060358]|uniref:Dabb family protein n=1 Tax=Lentzea sp. NPDC060358 TaxID=3347103 RepID=UPI00366242AB